MEVQNDKLCEYLNFETDMRDASIKSTSNSLGSPRLEKALPLLFVDCKLQKRLI
jgi:hypothetical protein